MRQYWKAAITVLLLVTVLVTLGLILRVPDALNQPSRRAAELRQAAAQVLDLTEQAKLLKDIAQYETDNQIKIWTTVVQAVGAVVLAVGGYFAYRNLRVAQENLKATQKKLDVDQEGQITNRFTQAIGQLGAEQKQGEPNREVRVGGIYALERIALDSPKDRWTILEVLAAYVRQNACRPQARPTAAQTSAAAAPLVPVERPTASVTGSLSDGATGETRPPPDIQAVLTVFKRLPLPDQRFMPPARREGQWPVVLDLRFTELEGAELWEGSLERIDFWGANLAKARFWSTELTDVKLERACLREASFFNAQIRAKVSLKDAQLQGASFWGTHGLTPGHVLEAHEHGRGSWLPDTWSEEERETVWAQWPEAAAVWKQRWRDEQQERE